MMGHPPHTHFQLSSASYRDDQRVEVEVGTTVSRVWRSSILGPGRSGVSPCSSTCQEPPESEPHFFLLQIKKIELEDQLFSGFKIIIHVRRMCISSRRSGLVFANSMFVVLY